MIPTTKVKVRTSRWASVVPLLLAASLAACSDPDTGTPLFSRVDLARTGISFANTLPEEAGFNIVEYLYYYNGGGVAVGDVNGDSLPDLYFTANLEPNRLYINEGNLSFRDVTDSAGVAGSADWTTGVTMADVNGDGLLDIYVSVVSGYLNRRGANELFVNNGDGTFTERAAEFGLAYAGYGTQASFFDYDNDGDLDVYLLNHSTHTERGVGPARARLERHPRSGDRLLRNDDGRFVDVSEQAGIYGSAIGYGLSVAVSDLNGDGCIDIYVANDFYENDYLYFNNCDGTFRESIVGSMAHTSRFSMGTDVGDVNNDGRPDLFALDMLPEDEAILKTSANAESFDLYELKRSSGYHHQFARNTLQLNLGDGQFSEIGYLAGVYASDWSWSALFADLDNDTDQDLYITNGIYRRPNDLDYINFASNQALLAAQGQAEQASAAALIEKMPTVKLPNYAFENLGDLRFHKVAEQWGLADEGFSNGAAYADLDLDGDLDLVVNNVNETAWIYENRTRQTSARSFLGVRLTSTDGNRFGVGSRLYASVGGRTLYREVVTTRGWQSSVDPAVHFGLGESESVDTLRVVWPGGRVQILLDVAANRYIEVRQEDAAPTDGPATRPSSPPIFRAVDESLLPDFEHHENTFIDFNREILIPHRVSLDGPAIAVGDVNRDGADDVFLGGAKWQPSALYVSTASGFLRTNEALWSADSLHEDVDAAFLDADNDGDLDLYVVSGGNEFWGENDALRDRLYVNDGRGLFTRSRDALPSIFENGCCVAPADYDGDGDVDLFVGSRVVSRNYGLSPASYLLQNTGSGVFTDVTAERAPDLRTAGMVTSATWSDYDADGQLDLIVTAEWQPVLVYRQDAGSFTTGTVAAGLEHTNGWWNSVAAADMDGDGDQDLILGNLGLNSQLKASRKEPVQLHIKDFDGNGSLDQIMTHYRNGVSYPFQNAEEIVRQIELLRKRYNTFTEFGARRIDDIFTPAELEDVTVLNAFDFASSYAENMDGTFRLRPLPTEAQFAPVYAIAIDDYDNDGNLDAIVAGNFSGVRPDRGIYDAGRGLLLLGDGGGGFRPVEHHESGIVLRGEVRKLRWLSLSDGRRVLVAARNNASLYGLESQL